MTVQTTANLTNALRTRYLKNYIEGANEERLYDQFCTPVQPQGDPIDGVSTVQAPFLSELPIVTAALSEQVDVTPVTMRDATATITGTSRGNAIQYSQELDIRHYTNYTAQAYKNVGKNQMMSVEWLALDTLLNGSLVFRTTARASLDAGTTGHNFGKSALTQVQSRLQTLGTPMMGPNVNGGPAWLAMGHTDPLMGDLVLDSDILAISQYQDKSIALNYELGQIGQFRLVGHHKAKVFGSAGAAHASVVATTLSSAANALATTIVVASSTNIGNAGRFLTIGTLETGATFYPTNERVQVISTTGTTITIAGNGPNGGLRWDHASGATVSNADTVYPVLFGHSMSCAKMWAQVTGPFGEVVGPKTTGNLDQWTILGWKWWGGFGIWVQTWLYRGEFSSRLDNVGI